MGNVLFYFGFWRRERTLADGDQIALKGIADAFRLARQSGYALADFPGDIPQTLGQGYALQDQAIDLWPDAIAGWKVGRILGELAHKHGAERLIGPIFDRNVQTYETPAIAEFAAISGGFCAVEAEYVFKLGADAPENVDELSTDQALDLVASLHIGIEIAGSPLVTINELGPCVVISDFGNNAGLIIGQQVLDWRARINDLEAVMRIDDLEIGRGSVQAFPGGISQALCFAIQVAAQRGKPLKKGMFISSGAVTGVHDIRAGQVAVADFGEYGAITCKCVTHQQAGA
jgi:2-keto-4-pentenoate hydratase